MKIVVVGGTGRIGARLVRLLAAGGHDAVAVSRSIGIDTTTGMGLAGALAGAEVVVDATNAPTLAPDAVLDFFRRSAEHLLPVERAAGVGHHVVLSIVGLDGLPGAGYMRAKLAQEQLVAASGVPYTLARATQFFEFLGTVADGVTADGVVHGSPALIQPIAADDVAELLAEIAVGPPANGVVDLAGPQAAPIGETLRRYLAAVGDRRPVLDDPAAGYFGATLEEKSLIPAGGHPQRLGRITLDAWLAR